LEIGVPGSAAATSEFRLKAPLGAGHGTKTPGSGCPSRACPNLSKQTFSTAARLIPKEVGVRGDWPGVE